MLKTPISINANVKRLLQLVPHTGPPVFVAVRPDKTAKVDECFLNVGKKIELDSGSMALGWTVWENDYLIEAEFHAVWKGYDGELVDITPKVNRESHVLFIPNLSAKYDGMQADNVRVNISGNAVVDDFIELFKARYRLLNKGERKNQLGEIILSGKDADDYRGIEIHIQGVQWMLSNQGTRSSPCFCGSGAKYKNCHGRDLVAKLRRI